jgi:hypothetical protein
MSSMAEKKEYELSGDATELTSSNDVQVGADALAVQTNDPVYDAKARVLNRAVHTILQ